MVTTILIGLSLQGCSSKEYIYIKATPYEFQEVEQPKIRSVRVLDEDVELYTAYVKNFRDIIDFFNTQIKDYKASFDNNNTKAK